MDRRRGLTVTSADTMIPIAPALHSRRGLSLDMGINRQQQNTSIYGPERFDWSRWLDIGDNAYDDSEVQRPSTPVKQTGSESCLPTPATTPCWKPTRPTRKCKTAHSSPTKAPFTFPPILPMQKPDSFQSIPNPNYQQEASSSPEKPVLQPPETFDPKLPEIGDDVFSDFTYHSSENSDTFSLCSPPSPAMTSYLSLSELPNTTQLAPVGRKAKKVPIAPAPSLLPASQKSDTSSGCPSPVRPALTPRAMSITELNLDSNINASLEETGVTIDDIAEYIDGPDPNDNKWICTFEGCMKRFGRKENIKSHVQTHLGDRQFKCNHCNKCFVRGHDLKRHAKIHTGVKPYPCECGNSFARHDALTRHKQRGMCSGAFVGVVRRAERRGRPKKNRPQLGERRNKATKTRQRLNKRTPELPSPEPSSCTSLASPLSQCFDGPSTRETSPARDLHHFDIEPIALPPNVFTFTPPASPSHSTGNVSSPARSYHSASLCPEDNNLLCLSPTKRFLDDIPEEFPEFPSLASGSPTPIKREHNVSPPARILWPAAADSTLAGESAINDFDDVFSSQTTASTFDGDQLPPLDPPSTSTTDLSETRSSQYDDELFLTQLNGDGSHMNSRYFSLSLSPPTEAFFDGFTSDLK